MKQALLKWKRQVRTESKLEVYEQNAQQQTLSATFGALKAHARTRKLCTAMVKSAHTQLKQQMLTTWIGKTSRSRMHGRILVRKLDEIIVKRRISPCFEQLMAYGKEDESLTTKSTGFRSNIDLKIKQRAFKEWANAQLRKVTLRTICAIPPTQRKRQGFTVLLENMITEKQEREQIMRIIKQFEKKRPENLLQF